jgi:hypothetical protein
MSLNLSALAHVSVAKTNIEAVTLLVNASKENNAPLLDKPSSRTHVFKPFVVKKGLKGVRAKTVVKKVKVFISSIHSFRKFKLKKKNWRILKSKLKYQIYQL